MGGYALARRAIFEGCRELAALSVSSLSQQRDPMDAAGIRREDTGSRISHHSQFHLTYLHSFAVAWRLAAWSADYPKAVRSSQRNGWYLPHRGGSGFGGFW